MICSMLAIIPMMVLVTIVALLSLLCTSVGDERPVLEKLTLVTDNVTRTYFVQFPDGQTPLSGWPVVFSFHGWTGEASRQAEYDGFRQKGSKTAIVVHVDGFSDPTNPSTYPANSFQSWHGGGSAGVEDGGVDGPTCNPSQLTAYSWQCYQSCMARGYCTPRSEGTKKCLWSHCKDDVAFVLDILKTLIELTAVDVVRVYASGHSNGAMFLYELASDMRSASSFTAIAPVSGLPHNGFNRGTVNQKLRILGFSGIDDQYVYPFPNVPYDPTKSYGAEYGWFFSSWTNTSSLWAKKHGLPDSHSRRLAANWDGLNCTGWSSDGTAIGADVAWCFYQGGHSCPNKVWDVVWDFFGLASSEGNCTV